MATLRTRLLGGLLILGATLITAPAHAASPTGGNAHVVLPPRLADPQITVDHAANLLQAPNWINVTGTGFSSGGSVDVYTYSATFQVLSMWAFPVGSGPSFCILSTVPTMGCWNPRPSGTFDGWGDDLYYGNGSPCPKTIYVHALDTTTNLWSNWLQVLPACSQ